MLRIYLFGPLRVLADATPLKFHALPRALPLLAYLLLHRQRPLKRDHLAFLFWPDTAEDVARSNLRRHLHDLRRALPAPLPDCPWLLAEGETVQWNPDAIYWLDVAEFERPGAAPEGLAAAVALYTDDLLPEVYDDWIFFERERLRNLLFADLERLTAWHEAQGDYKQAIAYASQALHRDPLREETARTLMALYYRAGDRSAALQEYRRFERSLQQELDVPPMPETRAVYEAIVRGTPLPVTQASGSGITVRPSPGNSLPAQVVPFIGRETELAELIALLCPVAGSGDAPCRLLTVTGAGGSGKTRLSIELAPRILKERPDLYPDGVRFIPLSGVSDSPLVVPAIAAALGVRETARASLLEDVKNNLRDKHVLLILDNFEHVMQAAGVVSELLAVAPGLGIVVTSRAVLRLYGEQEYPLAPLPLPDPARLPPLGDLARAPAVALFVDRARAVHPGFCLTQENATAVAEVCIRLDGLPLAIELAAARARLFTPQAMLERMGSRLPFLTAGARDLPARQATLRATIDWSFNLLAEPERRLFARLSVFVGGFPLTAAEQVAGTDGNADLALLDTLTSLVEQSMLRRLPEPGSDGEPRFRMMMLLREYAGERLAAQGELEAMRLRHIRYFLAFAQEGNHALRGADQMGWLARLETEHDNLRAAVMWAVEQVGPTAWLGLELAAALGWFWYIRGHWSEGNDWLLRLLTAAPDAPALVLAHATKSRALLLSALGRYDEAIPLFQRSLTLYAQHPDPVGQGDALSWLGRAEFRQKRYEAAEARGSEALSVSHAAGDRFGESIALRNLGDVMRLVGRYEDADRFFRRALDIGRSLGRGWALVMILNSIGEMARLLGRVERAAETYDEEISLHRSLGNPIQLAVALHNQGHARLRLGEPDRAAALFDESLTLHRSMDNRRGICLSLAGVAGVAAETGQAERAARLLGAVAVHLRPMGAHLMGPADQAEYDRHLTAVRAVLGEAAFERAWEAGRVLSFDQAVALGLATHPQNLILENSRATPH